MILYSVTVSIDPAIEKQWLRWARESAIPAVMSTSLPVSCKFLRLLTRLDDEGLTYSFQFYFNEKEDYEIYENLYAPKHQLRHDEQFAGQYVVFRTILEEI